MPTTPWPTLTLMTFILTPTAVSTLLVGDVTIMPSIANATSNAYLNEGLYHTLVFLISTLIQVYHFKVVQ